jgi:hypothetical protein
MQRQGPGLFGLWAWDNEEHDGARWGTMGGTTLPVAGTFDEVRI